jgi:hypothetical protein
MRSSRPGGWTPLFHGESFWLDGNGTFIHRNEFRESTDSIFIRPRIDLVAGLESPHSRSDANHDSSHIIAQNKWQAIRQKKFELSVSDFVIQWVYASGVNLDQNVIVSQLRLCAKPSAPLFSIALDDKCLHDIFRLTSPRPECDAATGLARQAAVPFEAQRPPSQRALDFEETACGAREHRRYIGVSGEAR